LLKYEHSNGSNLGGYVRQHPGTHQKSKLAETRPF